ncbi:hypothetical protein EDB89DRAFT_83932 [Lactarius sanguifluus]|nr:hypothetical protein EDB89DRAFT_83932 [Lactarius sanguifluus]
MYLVVCRRRAGCGVPLWVLTLARTAPRNSTTTPDFPHGARVPARQASRPTRTTPQIAAPEVKIPPQPVRPLAFSVILTSNRIARIHTSENQIAVLFHTMVLVKQSWRDPLTVARVTFSQACHGI